MKYDLAVIGVLFWMATILGNAPPWLKVAAGAIGGALLGSWIGDMMNNGM